MKMPKYILKKIEQHNELVDRAEKLENEILDWYNKKMSKYEDVDIPDEDFSDIVSGECTASYISINNMMENFHLVEEH